MVLIPDYKGYNTMLVMMSPEQERVAQGDVYDNIIDELNKRHAPRYRIYVLAKTLHAAWSTVTTLGKTALRSDCDVRRVGRGRLLAIDDISFVPLQAKPDSLLGCIGGVIPSGIEDWDLEIIDATNYWLSTDALFEVKELWF